MATSQIESMVEALGNDKSLACAMLNFVRYCDAVERVIERRTAENPLRSNTIDAVFKISCPRSGLFDRIDVGVFEWHVNELVDRLLAGEDTRPGTKAEVMAAMSAMSLVQPMNGDLILVYDMLFAEWNPEAHEKLGCPESHGLFEMWPGRAEEVFAEVREKLTDQSRKL